MNATTEHRFPSMGRRQDNGVALVTTVIMLSVITMMAVAFLTITRRERASVTAFNASSVAKDMATLGRERAIGEMTSRFYAEGNMFAYDLLVATNFLNPNGFDGAQSGLTNQTLNVTSPDRLNGANALENLSNMRFDPRPPVVLSTPGGTNDFRYFLDYNRNNAFEGTGILPVYDNGTLLGGEANPVLAELVGDPQWIGVLEDPSLPHSSTNRFIGRYTFIALPTGKSLDLNYIHNQGKRPGNELQDGYFRGAGAASWELNLAAFLHEINPNLWDYNYSPQLGLSSFGRAFDHANRLLRYRYGGDGYTALPTLGFEYPPAYVANAAAIYDSFLNDGIDSFADGPIETTERQDVNWPGSLNPNAFFEPEELFAGGRAYNTPQSGSPLTLADVLTETMTNHVSIPFDTEARYALYNMMGQLGFDSVPANEDKINLNWDNRGDLSRRVTRDPSGALPSNPQAAYPRADDFVHWDPEDLYMELCDRLLRQTFSFGVTNIPVHPINAYDASLHRILQVAANVCDANFHGASATDSQGYSRRATVDNPGEEEPFVFPMVFKPVLGSIGGTNIFIKGFEQLEAGGGEVIREGRWFDLNTEESISELGSAVADLNRESDDITVAGLPYVIAARKGIPAFNEAKMETEVSVARRVEVSRRSPFESFEAPKRIRQFHLLSVENEVGLEAWNPYEDRAINRDMTIYATNHVSLSISNVYADNRPSTLLARFNPNPVSARDNVVQGNSGWPASIAGARSSFKTPIDERFTHLDGAMFAGERLFNPSTEVVETLPWDEDLTTPDWTLYATNRFQYLLVDEETDWILDFVNIDNVVESFNISSALRGDLQGASLTSATDSSGAGAGTSPGRFWDNTLTDMPRIASDITVGIREQIMASLGEMNVPWNSASGDPIGGQDRQKRIQELREFMGLLPPSPRVATLTRKQLPYPVSRRLQWKTILQANDPLVHYTPEDLRAPTNTIPTDIPIMDTSNLGRINERYRPWGGNPNMDPAGDRNARNPAIKDALISSAVDWDFPNRAVTLDADSDYTGEKIPTLGALGAIHRGSPWQTIYLKSNGNGDDFVDTPRWREWAGHVNRPQLSHPTNDWQMLSAVTVAVNDAAARGLLGVNQTNRAAWAAVFGGVQIDNFGVNSVDDDDYIQPGTDAFRSLVEGINQARNQLGNPQTGTPGYFPYLGTLLSADELSLGSPYIQSPDTASDAVYEAIPRQILSLVKDDAPLVTIIAYGQTLEPAPASVVGQANRFNGIVTNYLPTSEYVTKSLVEYKPFRPVEDGVNEIPLHRFSATNDIIRAETLDFDSMDFSQ